MPDLPFRWEHSTTHISRAAFLSWEEGKLDWVERTIGDGHHRTYGLATLQWNPIATDIAIAYAESLELAGVTIIDFGGPPARRDLTHDPVRLVS